MGEKDTAGFLQFMNGMNESIAAQDEVRDQRLDQVRVQRDAERRARLGRLRARPRTKHKTHRVRSVFGYVDPK